MHQCFFHQQKNSVDKTEEHNVDFFELPLFYNYKEYHFNYSSNIQTKNSKFQYFLIFKATITKHMLLKILLDKYSYSEIIQISISSSFMVVSLLFPHHAPHRNQSTIG